MQPYKIIFVLSAILLSRLTALGGQSGTDWPVYGRDPGGTKYSPLAQINRRNVSQLTVAWKWKVGEQPIPEKGVSPGQFEATPLMIDDILYLPTPYNRVVALNANNGEEIWSYDPHAYNWRNPPPSIGFIHRGVAAWSNAKQRRIFLNSRWRLIALDAKTGKPTPDFGNNGDVDLTEVLGWKGDKPDYGSTSPPVVFKDLVIVGNSVPDNFVYKNAPPGDVLAFDVHNGHLVWRFHTIPRDDEFGSETWKDGLKELGGHANIWPPFVADEKRGLLYLPVTTPANDYYGGYRKGANLFGDSIVCLDANTGKRMWHFQVVHHGLWDYDGVMTPNVVTIHPDGKSIDAVVAVSKTGFLYAFDRITGKPVWPIEEKPVPESDVPGEETSPTQPFPLKPPPFAKQGFTLDDFVDFTPEIKSMALEKLKPYRLGPIFTPPSFEGTIQMPGSEGGANWGGASFDPESEILYVKSSNLPKVAQIRRPDPGVPDPAYIGSGGLSLTVGDGIPIQKPPYGVVTALDLRRGEKVWQVPVGDTPAVRNNPLLKGVKLPVLGSAGHSGLIVTKGGLIFISSGDIQLHALDTRDGKILWNGDLEFRSEATPMTYMTRAGRQFVVVAAGRGTDATLIAFALPEEHRSGSN